MDFGKILSQLRKEKQYTQHDVANYVTKVSKKPCSHKIISNWENDMSIPPAEQFLIMCELFGVTDIQRTFRGASSDYLGLSRLNSLGRKRVDEYVNLLSKDKQFTDYPYFELSVSEEPRRYIKLYETPVAAGSGFYLDSEDFTDFEADESVPDDADFAVKVGGDSMMPRFIDGQIIFIKKQETLEVGEIGIFELNGDAFLKKLGRGEFISLNARYAPIPIREFDSVHIFGKVLG
ncbi:MAG: XRE family transcriptional regulator [Oscillospiraceae bacterium]|nr:XRE family transcriptional regulator [Oscillospiraceae bacterium]